MSNTDLRKEVESLRAMLEEVRTAVGLKGQRSPDPTSKVPTAQPKEEDGVREAAPGKKTEAGMTQEQLAEFKKQQLLVNTLQNRIKELETRMLEAQTAIQEEDTRISELTKEEDEHTKALYREVDAINCSLSEKIALQRNEVKKLAGDEYKPINYDPFNYGEAYGGDLVDFQSRKSIIELKLQMNNLKCKLDDIGSYIKVSPEIDLGYQVVRMDQLLAATGFDRDLQAGAVTREHGLLLTQARTRTPDRVEYPRSEAFQTDKSKESQWQITDSIMQTMYRLEMELAELQRRGGQGAQGGSGRPLEELQETIKLMKETKADRDQLNEIIKNFPGQSTIKNQDGSDKILDPLEYVQKDALRDSLQRINGAIDGIAKRLGHMERSLPSEPNSSYNPRSYIGAPLPRPPGFGVQLTRGPTASRLNFTMAREYDIAVNGALRRFHLPNPCMLRSRPHTLPPHIRKSANSGKKTTDNMYIRGLDGKMYLGTVPPPATEQKSSSAQRKTISTHKSMDIKSKARTQKAPAKAAAPPVSPNTARKDKAATKIQAGFRGMQTRRSIETPRKSSTEENITANCLTLEPRWSDKDLMRVPSGFDNFQGNRAFHVFGSYP